MADVTLCSELLYRSAQDTNVVDPDEILVFVERKRVRLKERMAAEKNEKSNCD